MQGQQASHIAKPFILCARLYPYTFKNNVSNTVSLSIVN